MTNLLPKGIGLYFLRLPADPADTARRLAQGGIRWVALGAAWHDADETKLMNPPDRIADFAKGMRAAGITPHLWGYPWHDRVDRFVSDLRSCTTADIAGWLLDPELGFKGQPNALADLVQKARSAGPAGPLGLTSFGNTKVDFPFASAAGVDYGSPQLYTVDASGVRAGLAGWSAIGLPALIPSFGLYTSDGGKNRKKTAAELDAHLAAFDVAGIGAMIGWSYPWIDDSHWPVLKKVSDRLAGAG